MLKLVIPGSLTDLNKYINAERTNRYIGAKIKKDETERVYWLCKVQRLKPPSGPIGNIEFIWYCKDKRKDKDNTAYSKKYILDGLKLAKIISDDGWDDYLSFTDKFEIDAKNPRIEVNIKAIDE